MSTALTDRGDPLLTAWILAWGPRQLVRDPLDLFQANIFHPYRDTFAYSEHILAPALLAAPARLFTSNAVAVQNVSMVTAFVSLGFAAFLLFHWMSGDPVAAAFGAALTAFAPVRFGQLGHIQLLHTAAFPILLYGLWSWYEKGRRASAWIVAASLLFLALTSFYLGALALIAVAVFVLVSPLAFGARLALSSSVRLAPWILSAGVAALPFALPYWRLARNLGFVRDLEQNWLNWASHKDYIQPLSGSLAARIVPEFAVPRGRCLYLGVVTLTLALLALGTVLSSKTRRKREGVGAIILGALAVAAFLVSLGGWRWVGKDRLLLPFYYLHQLPGFSGIRAPHRFGILTDLAVVGLAVLGLTFLRRATARRFAAVPAAALVIGLGGVALLERVPPLPIRPVESVEVGREVPHVYRLLAEEKEDVRLIELPMTSSRREREPWDVIPYKQVFFSTIHWKRIVNGASGYSPPGFAELVTRMERFPSDGALEDLRSLPIDRVVVHRRLLDRPISAQVFDREGFRVLHECPEDVVAEVQRRPAPGEPALAPRMRVIALPAGGQPLRFLLEWDPSLPPLLYPPPRVEIALESHDVRGRSHRTNRLLWPAEPGIPRGFTVSVPASARSLSLEIRTEGKKTAAKRWELPQPPGGSP